MRALVFERHLNLVEAPSPQPRPNESLIRVRLAGICRTDIELMKGYMGFRGIPGHEFVGVVEASDRPEWVGLRVVGEINIGCGVCDWCRRGLQRHCPSRSVLGIQGKPGALADALTLPTSNLLHVPDSVPDTAAVFTEPLAAALEILEQTHVEPTHRIAVLGDGKLGSLCAWALALYTPHVTLIGHHPERFAPFESKGIGCVREAEGLETDAYDIVVEATGSPSGWATALKLVRSRGILILKSTFADRLAFDASPLVIREITVVGSRCGPFAPALHLLARGLIDPHPLIAGVFPPDRYDEAFALAASGSQKVLLRFE